MHSVGAGMAALVAGTVFAATHTGDGGRLRPQIAAPLALEHATVIAMDRDTALPDHTVLVAGGRIVWVGPAAEARIPREARRFDARGRWITPGLADMHVHLDREADLPRYPAAGVTTVRNMRGRAEHLVWREAVRRGTREGPTILTSGPTCCWRLSGNPAFMRIRSGDDAAALARDQARAGYDMIKLHSGITVAQFSRLATEARKAGIPIVGHLVPEVGLERSLAGGQVSIEHAEVFAGVDSAALLVIARRIAAAGAWVGSILSGGGGDCGSVAPAVAATVRALHRGGVRFLAGSDAGLDDSDPGAALHCELARLVAAGLSPREALAAATVNAGAFAARHVRGDSTRFGAVVPGYRADLLVLPRDPRSDISALAEPVAVVVRGRWTEPRPRR